jgi:hypothetical protein
MVADRQLVGGGRANCTLLMSIVDTPFCLWRLLDQDAMFSKRSPLCTFVAKYRSDATLQGLYVVGDQVFFRPYGTTFVCILNFLNYFLKGEEPK